jgi:hypothetical protein
MNEIRRDGGGANRQLFVTMGLIGLVVVSLGVGFLAGYITGGGRPDVATTAPTAPAGQAALNHVQGTTSDGHSVGPGGAVTCVYDLPTKDQWILSGMTCVCNEPHCNRAPLLACHCDNAHAMKSLAKQMIVEGKTADEIGAALEKRYGPGVLPTGGVRPSTPQGPRP